MSIVKTGTVTLEVSGAMDITLGLPTAPIKGYAGREVSFPVLTESVNDYTGNVVCSVAGFPPGTTFEIRPDDAAFVVPGTTFGFIVVAVLPAGVTPGTYNVLVTLTADDPA